MLLPFQIVVVLGIALAWSGEARAQDDTPLLLLHPESAFMAPLPGEVEFGISRGTLTDDVSYDRPKILLRRQSTQVEFVAGSWSDANGQTLHQREVLIVKPDYGVVVDQLYGNDSPAIMRVVHLPLASDLEPKNDTNVEGDVLRLTGGGGRRLKIQALDETPGTWSPYPPGAASTPGNEPPLYALWRTGALPASFGTAFFSGDSSGPSLKIEYVAPAEPMLVQFRVTFPNGRVDEVGLAWQDHALHLAGKDLHGWAAVARQGAGASGDIEVR